jgi:hypothetical protein
MAGSTITVMNNGVSPITIQGQIIQPNGNYAFDSTKIAAVCSDINFRCGFENGSLSANVNGITIDNNSANVSSLLDGIAAGDIS